MFQILKKEELSKRIEKLFNSHNASEYSWNWELEWKVPMSFEKTKEEFIKKLVKSSEVILEEIEAFLMLRKKVLKRK